MYKSTNEMDSSLGESAEEFKEIIDDLFGFNRRKAIVNSGKKMTKSNPSEEDASLASTAATSTGAGFIKLINNNNRFEHAKQPTSQSSASQSDKLHDYKLRLVDMSRLRESQQVATPHVASSSTSSSSTSSTSSVSASLSSLSSDCHLAQRSSEFKKSLIPANCEKENLNTNTNSNNCDKKVLYLVPKAAPLSTSTPIVHQLPPGRPNNPKSAVATSAPVVANSSPVKYGELIVLGYNGSINSAPLKSDSKTNMSSNPTNNGVNSSRRKSKFSLKARDRPNGVRPATQHNCQSSQEVSNLMEKNENHSVTYTLSRNHTVVVQYAKDERTDMFQIGRSTESAIDFVVLDTQVPTSAATSPQPTATTATTAAQSTISRYSCRIVVERSHPYTARIYAAGFDSTRRIFLGEKATKWKNERGELDGVTTNGVLIMHPSNGFGSSADNEWMEVSVCGAVFSLNESRLAPCLSSCAVPVKSATPATGGAKSNVLRDGTLIDLCGATLLWRSTDSLQRTPGKHYLEMNLEHLNSLRPQCPVGFKTLVFPSIGQPASVPAAAGNEARKHNYISKQLDDRIPMVYLKCGHVHGQHNWGVKKDNERECPLCRNVGPYVQLQIGLETSLYCDVNLKAEDGSCALFRPFAFLPCGHMASEATCKYWSRITVPQGATQGLSSICPFCAVQLCKEQPCVKLILQEAH